MGLDVTLMPLKRILQSEKRAAEHHAFLKQTGLTMPPGEDKDFDYTEKIGPYAVFHHIYRYAAHIELRGQPPSEPGTLPLDDPYYVELMTKPESRFDHLLRHAYDYGYYYPVDFPKPIEVKPEQKAGGGFFKKVFGGTAPEVTPVSFGSAVQLQKELMEINEHLGVPVRDEVPSETYADGIHGDEWGDEKWSWVVLYFMSRKAIEHGQIVVFE